MSQKILSLKRIYVYKHIGSKLNCIFKKNLGSKNNMGPKEFLNKPNLWWNKSVGHKIFWKREVISSKNFSKRKKIGLKNVISEKNFGSHKLMSPFIHFCKIVSFLSSMLLARAAGVPVSRRLGGQLATTLVATLNNNIFFFSSLFSVFPFFPSSTFLIEEVLGSKKLI